MKSALAALQAGVEELRWYIKSLRIEWELLAAATASPPCSDGDGIAAKLKAHTIGRAVAKRRFAYNSLIISLYGLLEQYIETLIRSYSSGLNSVVPRYAEMPDALKGTHVTLSFNLITKSEQSRYRGVVTPEALIANLHSCFSDQAAYRINTDAFCLHTANFRADVVDDLFSKVGIKGISQRLHLFSPFPEHLQAIYPETDVASLKPEKKFFHLNDLAERRNEVAHGNVSETLSYDIIEGYIDFIESYCMALSELVQCHYYEYVARHTGTALGKAIAVYNNTIVCLELRNVAVSVGDTLIAQTHNNDRPYLASEIQELQVNRRAIQSIPAVDLVKIGAKVALRCKKRFD